MLVLLLLSKCIGSLNAQLLHFCLICCACEREDYSALFVNKSIDNNLHLVCHAVAIFIHIIAFVAAEWPTDHSISFMESVECNRINNITPFGYTDCTRFQPKALNFSSIGVGFITSVTFPSIWRPLRSTSQQRLDRP